jgi:hypothetical protein
MATTRTLTEFLQHSGTILPEVERGEVVLRRRSGDEIVLIAEQHLRALEASLLVLAEAYRAGQLGGRQEQPRREWFALPWMSLLPLDDQRACLDELTATALAAVESGRLAALAETLAEWRATALATWDADRQRDREYDLDEPLPLERP